MLSAERQGRTCKSKVHNDMTGHHPTGVGTSGTTLGTTGTPTQDDLYDFTEVVPFADSPAPEPAPRSPQEPAVGHAAHVPPHQPAGAPVGELLPYEEVVLAQGPRTQAAPQPRRTPGATTAPVAAGRSDVYGTPSRAAKSARPQSREVRPAAPSRPKQDANSTRTVLLVAIGAVLLAIVVLAILILTRVVPFPGL